MNFVFPAFLAGIAALLLPWLLHRFNRETPPETPFPSTQFLESTRVPVSRKKRLRHLGLFSLRTLFLLAACLLFAQPYCTTDQNRASQQRNVFVVIDRSASMQADDRWSQARAKTAEVLNESQAPTSAVGSTQNAVQLFDIASTLTAHGELSTELSGANATLRSLSPSFESAPYGLMMQQLDALASRLDDPVDVVFITDAQESNLPLQRRLLRTQHIDNFTLHKVNTNAANLAVRASARAGDGVNVQVSAQVLYSHADDASNNSDAETPNTTSATLTVLAAGQTLESRTFNLTQGATESIVLSNLVMPSAAIDELTVRLDGDNDSLAIDNEISVPIQLDNPIQVGIGSIGMRMPEEGALFLRTALNTDGLARVINSSNNGTGLSDEASHWAVFIPHAAGTDVQVPQVVTDFVRAGGNVLLVLVPENGSEKSSVSNADFIGSIDTAHPLALGELDWQETRVYSPVSFNSLSTDRILMRTGSGLPLLVERNALSSIDSSDTQASGRLLFLADPLDGVASDLPLQSAFVDWIANTIRWFDASIAFPTQINAGESLLLPAQTQVLSPSGKTLRTLADSGQKNRLLLNEPGVYTVVTSMAEYPLAVTVPWEESNLTSFVEDKEGFWGQSDPTSSTADESLVEFDNNNGKNNETANALNTPSALDASKGRPWWPWLMPLLALALLAESLWANRLLSVRRDGV